MKKVVSLMLPLPLVVLLFACAGAPSGSEGTAQQSDMWRVELHSAELADNLTATLSAMQYGGGVINSTKEIEPGEGNTFLLLELTVEKIGTGRAAFSWADAHIEDSGGNAYYRHPNDTFLANLNLPRLRGTDIVLGKETGFACFEVSKGAEGLQFVADEGNIRIEILP